MSHCGVDLNKEWLPYMESRSHARSTHFKLKVTEMGIQVLNALEKLHTAGFCHWDLKLDNLCYDAGKYFLIDFAFA